MEGYVDEADLEAALAIAVGELRYVLDNPTADDVMFSVRTALTYLEPFV